MNPSRRDLSRLIALGSAAAVIGVPVVLVASTWEPLEPMPRNGRADADEPELQPSTDREQRRTERDGQTRRESNSERPRRARGDTETTAATPEP